MKKLLAALIVALTASVAQLALAGESIDSKIEMLGVPKFLHVSALSSRVKNHLLTLNMDVRNQDNNDSQAFYRARWLDESGDPVWSDEAWKPLLIHGNQTLHLRLVSPTPKAVDFKIEFSAENNSPSN